MVFRTPLLVRIEPWDEYLEHVSRRARREYRYAQAAHPDAAYREVPLERTLLQRWMDVWAEQIVEGKKQKWTYSVERFENEKWLLFDCGVGVHPLLVCDDYCYAGPPLYEKEKTPYAAKFMWFGAIRWCAENGVKWFDLGGGSQKTWRGLLEEPIESYKWIFVQTSIRRHPELAEPWWSQCCNCGWRQLVTKQEVCNGCKLI
jgi:hypothetical protein